VGGENSGSLFRETCNYLEGKLNNLSLFETTLNCKVKNIVAKKEGGVLSVNYDNTKILPPSRIYGYGIVILPSILKLEC